MERKPAILRRQISTQFYQYEGSLNFINDQLKEFNPKMNRLRDLDLFVLDNSIRETTVGQLRGHTLKDKFGIYEEVKKSGFKYCIVESFNHMTRLGDVFLEQIKETGDDMSSMFAFTDFVEVIDENKVPQDDIPIGLIKSKKLGIRNVVMEIDLVYHGIDYKIFNARQMCSLLYIRLQWIKKNLGADSLVFINFRDYSACMNYYPARVFKIVNFISRLSIKDRPFGIMYEDLGKYLPEEVAVWTKATRREMDNCGWTDGHLLVHVHQQWGMSDSTQLECLANGANGIWAGLCEEGAAMGHASSCITIMNLIRLGNQKVIEKFNCSYLREAAENVTKITTGANPRPKQPVYGARSLDIIFGLDPDKSRWDFNFADFLDIKPEMRISTLASPKMIVLKLEDYFGKDEQFNLEIALEMKSKLLENLRNDRKEESNSKVGIAMLFDQSGGQLTEAMSKVIEQDKSDSVHIDVLINKIRERWNVWDVSEDSQLTFDAFYNGFMAPYFGCYRCEDTLRGLQAVDMDNNGKVGWREFALYLLWAGRQYPETRTTEELLDITFRKGLIPAMQDVNLKAEEFRRATVKRKSFRDANNERRILELSTSRNDVFYYQDAYDDDDTFLEDDR